MNIDQFKAVNLDYPFSHVNENLHYIVSIFIFSLICYNQTQVLCKVYYYILIPIGNSI